jgi:hypothetical protein
MSRKRSLKAGICLVMAVVIILSLSTTNVFAASTKVVTVTQASSAVGPLNVVNFIQSTFISTVTYNYDDGSYKGTLRCIGISNWTQTYDHYENNVPNFKYTFDATYSGTVTEYPVTKAVTVVQASSATGPANVAEFIKSTFISTVTYNYDDGSYSGTLRCTGISNWTAAYDHYDTSNNVAILRYTFNATYSGIVTQY